MVTFGNEREKQVYERYFNFGIAWPHSQQRSKAIRVFRKTIDSEEFLQRVIALLNRYSASGLCTIRTQLSLRSVYRTIGSYSLTDHLSHSADSFGNLEFQLFHGPLSFLIFLYWSCMGLDRLNSGQQEIEFKFLRTQFLKNTSISHLLKIPWKK